MRDPRLLVVLLCTGIALAQDPALRSVPATDEPQIELLPVRSPGMGRVYRSFADETPWFVGADAVLASFEGFLFSFVRHLADRNSAALTKALPEALREARSGWDFVAGEGRWRLAGALASAARLLALDLPADLPPELTRDVDAEVADVLAEGIAVPRFVRAWREPPTDRVDWSIAKPTGIYTLTPRHEQLFRTVVYLRHLDPADLCLLVEKDADRRECEPMLRLLADLRSLELSEEAMWGQAVVPFWQPGRRIGSLAPWIDPPERGVLSKIARDMSSGSDDTLELVRRWLTGEATPTERRGGSFRALYLDALRTLACTAPGEWLGPALCSETWACHRVEAAAWGYNCLRQFDALEATGPVVGTPRVPTPLVFVEPVPDFYRRMAEAATLLRLVVMATVTDEDLGFVGWCEREHDLCNVLLALCLAQQEGRPGDADLQQALRAHLVRLDAPAWSKPPELGLGEGRQFRLRRGDCRGVRVPIVWQGQSLTARGGVVTVLIHGPGQEHWIEASWVR